MFLDIEHKIRFEYSDFVSESWVELRMEPQTNSSQIVNLFYLAVGPRTKISRYLDWSGNAVRHFSIAQFHRNIEVNSRCVVESKPPLVRLDQVRELMAKPAWLGPVIDFLSFGGPIQAYPSLLEFRDGIQIDPTLPVGKIVSMVGDYVHDQIEYKTNVTAYHSTIEDALNQCAGVCQDIAQITIGMLRLIGIPARYVNGYLHVPNLKSSTAESHAWLEFYSQEFGWVPYDPTGNVLPGEHHVVVATGRHYDEVPPNRGVYRGNATETLKATVVTKEVLAPVHSSFREEIQDIELPVYAEIPDRRSLGVFETQVDQSSQQQQQQ